MRKADNLPASCAVVTKSGSLDFLEPSGPVQTCNGTAFTMSSAYVVRSSEDFSNVNKVVVDGRTEV